MTDRPTPGPPPRPLPDGGGVVVTGTGTGGAATRVLIVEDDRTIGELVLQIMGEAGWSAAVTAPSSHAHLRSVVDALEPDCILLDGAGKGAFGRSWLDAAWLHERPRPVPVIMFSVDALACAEARLGTSRRSRAAAFSAVVEKPFELTVLEGAVRRILG